MDYYRVDRETTANEALLQEKLSKDELLYELIKAHEKIISAATAAHDRGVTREGRRWGPREILAHIAAWEANATVRVPKVLAGDPPGEYDDDAFNEAVITVIGEQSFETICHILCEAYQRDVKMLENLDEALFFPGNFAYDHAKAAISHCVEHIRELDER